MAKRAEEEEGRKEQDERREERRKEEEEERQERNMKYKPTNTVCQEVSYIVSVCCCTWPR